MHTDENKRYDRRNIASSLRRGVVTPNDYETYLSKLPDVSHKLFDPEEEPFSEGDLSAIHEEGALSKKKGRPKK